MRTIVEMENFLTELGYTNLRAETVRANYILADKDGKTICFYPYQIERMINMNFD